METKAYTESGILDLYAMGTLSAEEKVGVECMIAAHPEIQAELELIQNVINSYVGSFEKTQPADVKAKIIGAMDFSVTSSLDITNKRQIHS